MDENGKFIWPGFGENIRVLKWIVDRAQNKVSAQDTPLGHIPHLKDLDLSGLDLSKSKLEKLFEIKPSKWQPELDDIEKFFGQFGKHMPQEILEQYKMLKNSMNNGASDDYFYSIRHANRGGA